MAVAAQRVGTVVERAVMEAASEAEVVWGTVEAVMQDAAAKAEGFIQR